MKITVKEQREVRPKLLKIHCKVRDDFTAQLVDEDGTILKDQEDGYVPSLMPGEHYGDYVILDIDIETGQVVNWVKPTDKQIREFIGTEGDE